jgi:uncharacterized protein
MTKYLTGLLAATFLASACQAESQDAQAPAAQPPAVQQAATPPAPARPTCAHPIDANPALWEVHDADTTIYLFGTFHLLDACRDWFKGPIREAFDHSQELVLEVVLPENPVELQPLIMHVAIDPQSRTVTSRLTPREIGQLRQQLGPATDAIDQAHFEPWFVNLTLVQLTAQKLNLDPANGPETILRQAADRRHMQVTGLETAEFQFNIFDSQPEAAQFKMLRETLGHPDEAQRTLRPMLNAWSSGNVDRLAQIMNRETDEDPQMRRVLLTDRNANWARWIRDRLQRPGTVFLAVGGGHLGGNGSVQDQLRWLGIQSSRVR